MADLAVERDKQSIHDFMNSIGSPAGPQVAPPTAEAKPQAPPKAAAQPKAAAEPSGGFMQSMNDQALVYGVKHGVATLGTGAHMIVDGLNDLAFGNTYDDKVLGAQRTVLGAVQMGLSPFFGAGAAITKDLFRYHPGLANTQIPGDPSFIRTMLGQVPRRVSDEVYSQMTGEQQLAYKKQFEDLRKPFTIAEAIETALNLSLPIVAAHTLAKGPKGEVAKPAEEPAAPAAAEAAPAAEAPTVATPLLPERPPTRVTTGTFQGGTNVPELVQQMTEVRRTGEQPQTELVKQRLAQIEREYGETQRPQPPPTDAEAKAFAADVAEKPPVSTLENSARPFSIDWDGVAAEESYQRVAEQVGIKLPQQPKAFGPNDISYLDAISRDVDAHMDFLMKNLDDPRADDFNTAAAVKYIAEDRAAQVKLKGEAEPIDPGEVKQVATNMNAEIPSTMAAKLRSYLTDQSGAIWLENWVEAAKRGAKIGSSLWVNGLLSNPKLYAKKGAADIFSTAYAVPQRALMRMAHVLFFNNDPFGTASGETSALVYGAGRAMINTARLVKAGMDLPGVEPWKQTSIAENLGVAPDTPLGKGIDRLLQHPSKIIGGITDAAYSINYQMELAAQGVREAEMMNLQNNPVAYAAKVRDVQLNPANYPDIESAAQNAAGIRTYTNELGIVGQAVTTALNNAPGARILVPFSHLMTNMFKRATHFFPPTWAASYAWGQMGRQFEIGGAAREAALADLAAGTVLTGAMATLVFNGKCTGGGPTDPALRERWLATGRRPYSCYPNGIDADGAGGFSYKTGFGHFGSTLGTVADITEIAGELPRDSEQYERLLQIGGAIALGLSRSVRDNPMLYDFSHAISQIDSPDQTGMEQLAKSLARTLVPMGWAAANKEYFNQTLKEVRTPLDAIRDAAWGRDLVDRRDRITGEPMLYPTGVGPDIASPYSYSELTDDIVAKELYQERVKVSRLPWSIDGRLPSPYVQMTEPSPKDGIALTGELRDRWQDYITEDRLGGKNLHDRLEAIIMSPRYQQLPSWPSTVRGDELSAIISNYTEAGRVKLLTKDLSTEFKENRKARARMNLPLTNPMSTGEGPRSVIPSIRWSSQP